MNFSATNPEKIREGVRRLSVMIKKTLSEK